ncbi:hypothetical protein [Burkholderia gladioli]|uniref:hypothetical protein n=1 Tax=Burkholderia gladioli TaxID=28095 RepID=UPI000F5431D4|nr:hypothetical protein [Burkholderia gladioli]
MTRVSGIEMHRARQVALSGAGLSAVAVSFLKLLEDFLASGLCGDLGLQLRRASSSVAEDFSLNTPHGEIDAMFDHAFKGTKIVGRYRFFAMDRSLSSADASKTIMTILLDSNRMLAFDPHQPFEWELDMGPRHTQEVMSDFLLSLLAHQQATLTAY